MKKFGLWLLPVTAILLEALPFGVYMTFAPSPDRRIVKTYSYFSLLPVGYGQIAPFLTAVLTCAALCLALIFLWKGSKKVGSALSFVSGAGALVILFSFLYQIEHNYWLGSLIAGLLALEWGLSRNLLRCQKKSE